ncbi:hypothetical protein SRB5_63000 [Streptomyces sp. RB5]|uniref:Uncharacterized protein n=2 Tax=Streptomyces smaragdinus TaxID=2585196 RepID=A0A7K0CRI8_9ACTN|nr:hypothetical protein [Streptomyces smaragdinus]
MTQSTSHRTEQTQREKSITMCPHQPTCPTADSEDREAAHPVAHHPEQGWSLLCNGVVLFEDTGELLPDGRIIAPHRPLRTTGVITAA